VVQWSASSGFGSTVQWEVSAESGEGASVSLAQLRHRELRQAREFRTRFAGREHRPDRVAVSRRARESQRLPGRLTQPLPVIDHAHQRLLSSYLREQAERGQPGQEPVFTDFSQELFSSDAR
jgi:hypothetical protein